MSSIDETSPPGVSRRMTTASKSSRSARSNCSSTKSRVTGLTSLSNSIARTLAAEAPAGAASAAAAARSSRKKTRTTALFTRKDSIRRGPLDGRESGGSVTLDVPPVKLLAAIAVALAFPASALAQDAQLVTQEVSLGAGARTLASARPPVFDLVGLHWRGSGDVLFRTRSVAGRWTAWRAAQPEPFDVPDAGTPEGRSALEWRLGNPHWVGPSNAIQYRPRGRVTRLRAHFVRSTVRSVPARTLSIAGSPAVIPRAGWRADEEIRRAGPAYSQSLRFAVVHHTAGANAYTAAQSAAIVKAIQVYHVKGNGWNDLGYNFIVDKYGQVFEGRYGGVERNVIGAHAEGFNTGSVGVALLGTYGNAQPTAKALDAIAALLAWRLDVAHVD